MPRGDAAILKQFSARWDSGALIRVVRSVRLPHLDAETITRLKYHATATGARRTIPLVIFLGICLVSLGFIALRRGGARSADTPVTLAPRHAGGRAVAVKTAIPTAPTSTVKSRAFSSDYKVLLQRSMFAIGGRPLVGRSSPAVALNGAAASRETTLSLKGISQEDARFNAFVEDITVKRVMEYHVGDAVGNGRIVDMTLRDLGYEVDGKVMRIEIGSGMNGSAAGQPMPLSQAPANLLSGKSSRHKHQ